MWKHGRLIVDQPWAGEAPWPDALWTFSPLGYRPYDDVWAIVPTYSPGLPMLMAAAQLVGGHAAGFWVVPISGAVLILATYGLGRTLGSARVGVWAAWLVATSPVVLFMLMAPMSDVPVAAAWAAAIYFLLARPSIGGAAAAGLSASIAILIRPNLAPAAALMAAWYLVRYWRDRSPGRGRILRELGVFLAVGILGATAVAVINRALYGSPFRSGYGNLDYLFQVSNIVPNLKQYALWLIETQTPFGLAGLVLLFVPMRRIWRLPDRAMLIVPALFVGFLWAQYCYYKVFDAWWYLRFLLPCWPFMAIGLATAAEAASASFGRWARPVVAVVLLAIGGYGVYVARDRYAFDQWRGEARYVTVARTVRSVTDRNSVILSMQQSGSVRYYGGRLTLRFDWLHERWLDRTLAWLIAHGVHPYALLDDWEVSMFRERFGALSEVGRLGFKPIVTYQGSSTTYLYDLASVPSAQPEPLVINETWSNVRYASPAPAPRLVLTK